MAGLRRPANIGDKISAEHTSRTCLCAPARPDSHFSMRAVRCGGAAIACVFLRSNKMQPTVNRTSIIADIAAHAVRIHREPGPAATTSGNVSPLDGAVALDGHAAATGAA